MRLAAKVRPSRKGNGLSAGEGLIGIDRLLQNVRHGRFEQSLAGLTGVGALITGVEIWLEHDRASFANRMMWVPVALTPAMAAAGIAGIFSKRAAKTFLPLISSVVLFNSMQGEYLHLRGSRPASRRVRAQFRALQRRDGSTHLCAAPLRPGRWHGARCLHSPPGESNEWGSLRARPSSGSRATT